MAPGEYLEKPTLAPEELTLTPDPEELTLTLAPEELTLTKRPALTVLQQQAHQLSVEAGRNSRERKHSCAEARECRRARRQI